MLKDRELSATLVRHIQGKKCLIYGFESHRAHSHQQGWFSSVKITRPQGPRLHVSLLKKGKSVLELFLLRPLQQSVVTAHRPCWETGHISLLASIVSEVTCHQGNDLTGITWDQATCLGFIPVEWESGHPGLWAVRVIIHSSVDCYKCKQVVKLIQRQTGRH